MYSYPFDNWSVNIISIILSVRNATSFVLLPDATKSNFDSLSWSLLNLIQCSLVINIPGYQCSLVIKKQNIQTRAKQLAFLHRHLNLVKISFFASFNLSKIL